METQSVIDLLARAQKTQGWNLRSELPCVARLDGGCRLHVVPAWLWQPRVRPRQRWFDSPAVQLRRA